MCAVQPNGNNLAVGWFVAHTALNMFKWRDLVRVSSNVMVLFYYGVQRIQTKTYESKPFTFSVIRRIV